MPSLARWVQDYLQRRIDTGVYVNLISILQHQEHEVPAKHFFRQAGLLFPADVRFQTALSPS